MSNVIKIKSGLDIKLYGEADKSVVAVNADSYAFKPKDFLGITPKLMVQENDIIKAGSPLFYAKQNERILFCSSVSGRVSAIIRGEKRVIEEIRIEPDKEQVYEDFGSEEISSLDRKQVVEKLLKSGLWTLIRKRPYSVIPNPEAEPKCIIIKGFDSAPLSLDYDLSVSGKGKELQAGVSVLKKLCSGTIHLNINNQTTQSPELLGLKDVQINKFEGPHPAGNISTQIAKLDPINKGESIWYIDAQDLAIIGKLFLTGKLIGERVIALVGQEVLSPIHFRVMLGSSIEPMIWRNINEESNKRFISGNILTGKTISQEGYLGAYDNTITIITEGDYSEFLGWIMPGIEKFSFSQTFLSGFFKFLPSVLRPTYNADTNLHGGRRPFVLSGEFEKVVPLDIYPLQLIKACVIEDIDLMEQLGIYEVDSEDFALCELIDTSKTDIQEIVRKGLELMRKEMGE